MKKLGKENGSITLFVLVSMLFLVFLLIGIYMISANRQESQTVEMSRIKEIYEKDLNNIDDVYQTIVNPDESAVKAGNVSTRNKKDNYIDINGDTATIPQGFTVSGIIDEQEIENGLVIYDIPVEEVEKVNWNADTDSDGIKDVQEKYDQYIWIPCTEDGANGSIKYDRHEFTAEGLTNDRTKGEYSEERKCYNIYRAKDKSYYFYEEMPAEEIASIKKYGGYYIGRYEAGISNDKQKRTAKNINDTVEQLETSHGRAISQAKKNVYTWVTRDQSKGLAENLDSNHNGIITRLCSSYAWDTALKFIESNEKYSSYPTNSVGGNYNVATGGTGKLSTTGYDKTHPCNIYDMGGNVYEWTTEQSTGNQGPYVCRGGMYGITANESPASYTDYQGSPIVYASDSFGFRVTLYVK